MEETSYGMTFENKKVNQIHVSIEQQQKKV